MNNITEQLRKHGMETFLFLDDTRYPYDGGWALVRNYKEFVAYIEEHGCPDVISFDHDLAQEHYPVCNGNDPLTEKIPYGTYQEKTGYDCAKYLVEKQVFPRVAIIHSWNPAGCQNIIHELRRHVTVVIEKRFAV